MTYALTYQFADGSSALIGTYASRYSAEDCATDLATIERRPTDYVDYTITELPSARPTHMRPLHLALNDYVPRRPWHTEPPMWVRWRDTRAQMREHIRGNVDSYSVNRVLGAFDRMNEKAGPIYTVAEFDARMELIRTKAIQWYERHVICWDGTRRFVNRFGLREIECADVIHPGDENYECTDDYCDNPDCERDRDHTHTVTMNVRVTFTVTNRLDAYDTREEIRHSVYVDSDGINGVDDIDWDSFSADVESVYVETDD